MNRNFLKTAYFMATALLFTACSQDETTDGNTLPEGKYPLQIASISMNVESGEAKPWGADAPQTRVTENTTDGNSSVWQDGDTINVQISGKLSDGTDYTSTGQYTVQVDADNKITSVTAVTGKAAYWHSKEAATVNAWYASPLGKDGKTVDLSKQSEKLAYVMTATQENASFNEPVQLAFSHALAKVRVTLSGGTADLTDAEVKVSILAPPSCTVDGGKVTAGTETAYIPMHRVTYGGNVCYEANVTPGLELSKDAFKVEVNGKTAYCSTAAVSTQAGQCRDITLTVDNAPITLAYNTPININDNGEYTINGIQGLCNTTITIDGSPTVILNNVAINNGEGNCIHIKKGSPTIILKGENWLQTDNIEKAPIFHIGESANVTIQGTGKLTIQANGGSTPAIGAGSEDTCGVTSTRQSHFLPMILRLRNMVLYSPTGKTQSGESFFSSTPLYFSISSMAIGNNFTTYATPVFIRFPISHVPPSESVWILS